MNAIEGQCSYCHAEPGKRCRKPSGTEVYYTYTHKGRGPRLSNATQIQKTPGGDMNRLSFTGDLLPLGYADNRAVVRFRIWDPKRGDPLLAGVAFRDEAAEVIREQLRLLGTVVGDAGATVRTIDLALDERESLDSSVARRQFRRLLGFPNTLGWGT